MATSWANGTLTISRAATAASEWVVKRLHPEAPQTPATPTLTAGQWQAIAEAHTALRRAQDAFEQARRQWALVSAATGIGPEWTVDLDAREVRPREGES
jgi:hypothetical protein